MDQFADLRTKIIPLLRPYVKRISVFGSYARGQQTAESDIDLLVELKPSEQRPSLGLFEIIRLERELQNQLGCAVDLVTEQGISPRIKTNVERDRVIVYEETR